MAVNDLTGKNIQDTYQRVIQTDGASVADGTGSLLPISFDGNNVIISGSLTATEYSVTSSVTNVVFQQQSGSTIFGDSQDDTHVFTGSLISSVGNISGSGTSTGSFGSLKVDGGSRLYIQNGLISSHLPYQHSNYGNFNFKNAYMIKMGIGTIEHLRITGSSSVTPNEVMIGKKNSGSPYKVNLNVLGDWGVGTNPILFTSGALHKVGVNCEPKSADSLFTIDGDLNISSSNGHITASGNISASGKLIGMIDGGRF